MKKIFVLPVILIVILFSCGKADKNNDLSTKLSEKVVQKAEPIQHVYHYNCSGNCSGGGECTMSINVQQGYVECDCEGCTLTVMIEKADGFITPGNQRELIDELNSKYLFAKELTSFVENNYNTQVYNITSIEYVTYNSDYYLLYDFITQTGIRESVMYAKINGSKEEPGHTYEIDCSGSCDNPGETCRERFIFEPPSAECTCQGANCNLKVNVTK